MYNELLLIIKACVEFWKGFFASDNKSEYMRKKDAIGPILMLIFSVLIFCLMVYSVIKLLTGTPETSATSNSVVPIIAEKTQTIPIDGKNIVCNVKIELVVPKN